MNLSCGARWLVETQRFYRWKEMILVTVNKVFFVWLGRKLQ